MDIFSDLFTSLEDPNVLIVLGLVVCIVLFLFEGYKYFKYKMKSDLMDFSLLGIVGTSSFILFDDLFLSGLAVIFILMIIGTYELRESPVWVRLMGSFTITYGYLLFGMMLDKLIFQIYPYGVIILGVLLQTKQISGFFYSTMMWVLLISAFGFFGKRFILVSRFLSPQYVYLFAYSAVYLVIFTTGIVPTDYRYLALFGANIFLYCISGWLLTFLFQIKPLQDERSLNLVRKVEAKINTKIRAVGIVQAPILNAFAYGPFFDQRFAFIVKDINNFSDEELLGITAHEISHLKGKHTFWLLWVGFFDLFVRTIFHIPLNTLDFAAGVAGNWDFFSYYVVNILFFAVALIFVRVMEANADKRTKEIGYGHELAGALFTLEGFYRGIAGELGLNAQLLSDTERTLAEEKRFTGEAAIEMHNKLLNPSRYNLVMNLIVSHPPTPFRIAAMVSDLFGSIRLALLPILLIIPGFRGREIARLRTTQEEFAQVLTLEYKKKFQSVNSFDEVTFTRGVLSYYSNRGILLISKLNPKEYYTGTLKEIKVSGNIVDPFKYVIVDGPQEKEINTKNFSIQVFEPDTPYVIKGKQIATLKSIEQNQKGKYTFIYEKNQSKITLKYLGISLKDFSLKESFIIQKRGIYEPLTLTSINGEQQIDTLFTNDPSNLKNIPFTFLSYNPGSELELIGKDMKINLSPIVLFLYKKFEKENLSLIKYLVESKAKVVLYTSKDPDIGIPCEFTNVNKDNQVFYIASGETKEEQLGVRQVDAVVLRQPYKLIQSTNEIGFFSKMADKVFSRGKKFTSV